MSVVAVKAVERRGSRCLAWSLGLFNVQLHVIHVLFWANSQHLYIYFYSDEVMIDFSSLCTHLQVTTPKIGWFLNEESRVQVSLSFLDKMLSKNLSLLLWYNPLNTSTTPYPFIIMGKMVFIKVRHRRRDLRYAACVAEHDDTTHNWAGPSSARLKNPEKMSKFARGIEPVTSSSWLKDMPLYYAADGDNTKHKMYSIRSWE